MAQEIIEWVLTVLKTTPLRWTNLMGSLPAELLTRQPLPGEWSAVECLQHLIDVEEHVFRFRVQCLLDGKDRFPGFFPDEEGSKLDDNPDFAGLAAQFARMRQESFPVLSLITPDDLSREAVHGELGLVTLENLLNEWAAHDLNHLVQAERALMQPFIQDCGAWQLYFTDHAVEA